MAAEDVNIRPATANDISLMLALDRECPTAAHWTKQQYQNLLAAPGGGVESLVLVAEEAADSEAGQNPHLWQNRPEVGHPRILGFLVARHVPPEWELENIVVAPGVRGKGLGTRFLGRLLRRAAQTSEAVFLEVRESNTAARKLYEKAGFELSGRRKSYYSSPSEDALMYRHSPR